MKPIQTGLDMLYKGYYGELSPKQKEEVNNLLDSVDRIVSLIGEFRRISQLRMSEVSIEKSKHSLYSTIEEAIQKHKSTIKEKKIDLKIDISGGPQAVYDNRMLIKVIQIIVENAIDYTKDKIQIKGWKRSNKIYITVRDNGIGVPEEVQEKIFEPFYKIERVKENRARRSIQRDFAGAGIDLTIAKRIINAHNGRIKVESEVGEETTFKIILPDVSP